MSRNRRSRRHDPEVVPAGTGTRVAELEEQIQIDEEMLEPGTWEQPWLEFCQQENARRTTPMTPFEKMEAIPKEHWRELDVYLYRLEPKVVNRGEYAYIDKYTLPFNEEQLGHDHGGGKYEIWLKRGKRVLFQLTSTMDPARWGPMKALDGQRFKASGELIPGAAPSSAPPEKSSELADAVRAVGEVIAKTQGAGGIETIQKALEASSAIQADTMKNSLELQRKAFESVTGISDKKPAGPEQALWTKVIDRAFQPPPAGPTLAEQLALVEKVFSIVKPERNPSPSLADQFKGLEFFGIKGIDDLVKLHGGGNDSLWAPVLMECAKNLPALFNLFSQYQERAFQRQLILAQVARGEKPSLPSAEVPRVPAASPGAASGPGQTAPAQTPEELTLIAIGEIARYFMAGWDGGAAAVHIWMDIPGAVPVLQNLLVDENTLAAAIAQVPQFSGFPQNPTWAPFVKDFTATLKTALATAKSEPEPEDDETENDEPEPAGSAASS